MLVDRLNASGSASRRAGQYAAVLGLVAAAFPVVASAQPPGPSGFNTSIFSAAGDTKTGFSITSFGDTRIGWAQSGSTTISSFQIGVSGTFGSPPNAWDMTSGTSFSIPVIGTIKNLQTLATVPVDTVNFFPFNGVQYLSLSTSGSGLPVLLNQFWNLVLDPSPATFEIDLPIYNFNSGTYQSTFGNTINTMTIVAPVPEPSTCAVALAGIACGGFSMWRRRRNRRRATSGRCPAATRTLAIIAMGMVCFSMRTADAAPSLADITWGSATNIAGDSDVDTTGTLVYAYNFGSSASATTQTINGVTFQPFVIQDFTLTQTTGDVTVSENNGYLISDLNVGSANTPFSGLSPTYRSLLSSEVYSSNFATMRFDLGGLTPGESYRLQWWTNDSSAITYGTGDYYFENVIGAGNTSSVTLDSNTSNAVGGLGQYVIGTFTASGTTASFTLTGSGTGFVTFPIVNALQLRIVAVPEPSTSCMALAGVACGGYSMWRRRRRA